MINGKKLVALCTSRVYEPQNHGFIVKVNERLKAEGYSTLVFTINSDIYWEEDRVATEKYVYDLIPYDYIDAVIIMDEKIKSHKIAHKIIGKAAERNIPVVTADGRYENTSCVNYDYEGGFEKVVRHVIEYHKIKRPHMMAGHFDNEFSNKRIEVFKKVLEENGIPFSQSMISYGDFWAVPCRKAMRELIDRGNLPEAIICANDIMAVTVSEMLTNEGYKIPEDIMVTGFDGYDEIYFTTPKITSASCDMNLLADAAVDVLFESLKDNKTHDKLISPVFVANESCGCPECNEHPSILRNWFKESFARLNDDNRVLQMMTSSMEISTTPGQLTSCIESYKTYGALVAVDRKIFVDEISYFTDADIDGKKKEFVLIYDDEHPSRYKEDTFSLPAEGECEYTEDILSPSIRDRILEATENGYPLIFNSLDCMNRPFGFICYAFKDYHIANYTNSMSVTMAISTGIGGYNNIRYQSTLIKKMDEMYLHDALTGLYNRVGFQNKFNAVRKKPEHYGKKVTIMMSDLDGLKYINDNFGHAEGDNAIRTVATALAKAVPEGSITTRFGGDEIFSVIFGECNPGRIMESIDRYLEDYNVNAYKPYKVSTSSGYVVAILDDFFDFSREIREADEKMYMIKTNKKRQRN